MHRSVVGLLLAVAACFVLGCGDSTAPPTPTSIVFSPPSVTFDAIGATKAVTATVLDQHGHAMPNTILVWSSSNRSVVGVLPNFTAPVPTATVFASLDGSVTVVAAIGTVQATLPVTVAQVATTIQKSAGDQQFGIAGKPLPNAVVVRVVDRLGSPITRRLVTFSVASGGGSVTGSVQTTDMFGAASLGAWTLGPFPGRNSLEVDAGSSNGPTVLFTATALGSVPFVLLHNGGDNQAAMAGEPVPAPLSVLVTDSLGAPAAGVGVTFAVSAGNGTVTGATTTSNAAGIATLGEWTLDSHAGYDTVTAAVPGVAVRPLVFSAAGCEGGGGPGLDITVCFDTPMTPTQQKSFEDAAVRWGTIITSHLPNVPTSLSENMCGPGSPSVGMTVDDILIFASLTTIDGPGGVLASSGPCVIRAPAGLPVIGTMRFDTADFANLEAAGTLSSVVLHEMGHVIGIGSFWGLKGLLQNPSSAGNQLDTYYSGTNGIAGFNEIGGMSYTGGQKVPVENTGGAGTINLHWRESVLRNELMTGFLDLGSNPLSILTVSSLVDLGYTVDTTAADPFSLVLSDRAPVFDMGTLSAISLGNDGYAGPVWTIDTRGRIIRIPPPARP